MAALQTANIVLPKEVSTAIVQEAHKTSSIATLAGADQSGFFDDAYNVFTGKARGHVVAEGEKKKAYDQTVSPVEGTRITVQTTTRVSKQLQWADEDNQLEILDAIQSDQSAAVGETLDYAIYHAIDPLSGSAVDSLTAKALATLAQQVTSTDNPMADLDAMTDKLINWTINGIALTPAFANTLRKLRAAGTGARLYDIPLDLRATTIDGIPAAVTQSVGGAYATEATNVLAFMGQFDGNIRWRLAKPITAEIIPYGNPDGAGDLAEMNQVAYRTEAVFSFAVLNPKAIAVLKSAGAKASVRKATR